jgi:hypothetical protein
MARMMENPRYNVVSARLTDEEKKQFVKVCDGVPQSEFVRQIILEKIQTIK